MSTATSYSNVEKFEGEVLDVVATELVNNETRFVGLMDTAITNGETTLAGAAAAAAKAHGGIAGVLGGSLANLVNETLGNLVPTAETNAKHGFDLLVSAIQAKAKSLGG